MRAYYNTLLDKLQVCILMFCDICGIQSFYFLKCTLTIAVSRFEPLNLDNLILQTKHTQRARSAMTWDKEPQRRKHNVTLRPLNKARRYSLPAKGFAKAISRIVVHGKTRPLIMEQNMEASPSMLCSMISISAYQWKQVGDPSEIRTPDTLIKSQVLCQLS